MKKVVSKVAQFIDVIVCVLLVIIAISKGGFYKENILFPTVMLTALGVFCALRSLIKNIKENGVITKNKLVTALDIFMLLLPIVYILPVVFDTYASLENSIFEAIRYTNVSIIYYIIRNSKNKKLYAKILVFLAIIIAVFGIDELTFKIVENFNLSITYLTTTSGVISSTVQYANVAALIMVIGLNFLLYSFPLKPSVAFISVLLQTCILLTSSRMGLAILVITITFHVILYKKQKMQGNLRFCIITFLVSCVMSGIQTVCIAYENVALILIAYVILAFVIYVMSKIKTEKLHTICKSNKKVAIYLAIIAVCAIIIVFSTTGSLVIKEGNIKTKRLYDFLPGENSIEIVADDNECEFEVTISQIYESFKTEQLVTKSSKEILDAPLVFNVSEQAKAIEVQIKAIQSDVKIQKMILNSNSIALSYVFLPDRLVSRVVDSWTLDLSNTLRFEYYKDGIKLAMKSPIVGLGGEGFKLCYQSVQDTSYISSEAHSFLIQALVETGLLGVTVFIGIFVIAILMCIRLIKIDKNNVTLFVAVLTIFIMSLFDLTFSFAISTYIFAVILAIVSAKLLENDEKYVYKVNNATALVKLGVICFSVILLVLEFVYTTKVYIASMIKVTVPNPEAALEVYEQEVLESITALEKKLKWDKYNINYMIDLDKNYGEYIEILKKYSLSSAVQQEKDDINTQLGSCILKQKILSDKMIDYEYYNKYAIEKVAINYFSNYIRYADILSNNYENSEVAYTFFLNYALKLTKRLLVLGEHNLVANEMYNSILNTYLEELKLQNKYLGSEAVYSVIQDIEKLLNVE